MRRLLAVLLLTQSWGYSAQAAEEKVHPKVDDRAIIAILVSAVRPEYPYEALLRRISGHGVAVLKIDSAAGKVVSCEMAPSTGSEILDEAAIQAFREWRFKPGTIAGVRIPIAFILPGQGGDF